MAENVFDSPVERGYLAQVTHEDEVRALLAKPGSLFISVLIQPPIVCMLVILSR